MERKWTKVLAFVCILVLFCALVALAAAKWVDHMDPDAPVPVEGVWDPVRTNLLVAGAGICGMLICVAVRSRGTRSKDSADPNEQPWEK